MVSTSQQALAPAYRLTVDGVDVTSQVSPRLLSLSLTDKPGLEADELTLELTDHDGRLALPPVGGKVRVAIGWYGKGLTDKGSFTIDEVGFSGPPDKINLSAKSADFRGKTKEQRDHSYDGTTLGAVVSEIADRQSLTPAIDADLGATVIDHIDQTNESDVNFLQRLAKDHDALCQIKDGRLLFMPMAAEKTVSGGAIPSSTISRNMVTKYSFSTAERESSHTAVKAKYQDNATGDQEEAIAGEVKGDKSSKTLKKVFATKAEAQKAADSELARIKRGKNELRLDLAYGDATVISNSRLRVAGFKSVIDATNWLIEDVTHTINSSGFGTSLTASQAE